MVAFITVSQNPVIFKYSDVVLHHLVDFTVEWDTGDPAVKARLSRSLNGGAEAVLPGAPVRVGVMTQHIGLDQVPTFVLRRASNAAEIGRVTVTTQKNALAQAMTDPDLGFIYGLKVQLPGDANAEPGRPDLRARGGFGNLGQVVHGDTVHGLCGEVLAHP